MPDIDSRSTRLIALRNEGRHAEALPLLQELFAEAGQTLNPARSSYFMIMLEWKFLAEAYAPAYAALQAERDAQIQLLLSGNTFGGRSRFSLIAEMNDTLGDARSTADLFVRLDTCAPELASQYAWQALRSAGKPCQPSSSQAISRWRSAITAPRWSTSIWSMSWPPACPCFLRRARRRGWRRN